jgi:ABC transporter DrrB family efflux protein
MSPFLQLLLARLREFYREPEAIFWVYGFPVLLAVGLGIAFWSHEPEPPAVDVQETLDTASGAKLLRERLETDKLPVELHDPDSCRQRLRTGKTTLYVVLLADGFRYVYDPARPESLLARSRVDDVIKRWKGGIQIQTESAAAGKEAEPGVTRWKSDQASWITVDSLTKEPGNRYIDFLMPGLMGLSLMGGGLWGVGFVLVDMRVRKLIKRFVATPMRRTDFLLSILTARMAFMLPEMVILVLVGWLGFGVPMQGSVLTWGLVVLVGAFAFAGIGLLVACRASKTETVSGLMNLVMLPMWLLSGTFFSSKRFPDAAQPFIQALPLTQVNDALREVMLEGVSVVGVGWRLAILAAWAVVSFALALRWFRWQ